MTHLGCIVVYRIDLVGKGYQYRGTVELIYTGYHLAGTRITRETAWPFRCSTRNAC